MRDRHATFNLSVDLVPEVQKLQRKSQKIKTIVRVMEAYVMGKKMAKLRALPCGGEFLWITNGKGRNREATV